MDTIDNLTTEERIAKLKECIGLELDMCDIVNTPTVCQASSTPEGKQLMIQNIFEYCIKMNLEVGQAIVEYEKNFNPNIPD